MWDWLTRYVVPGVLAAMVLLLVLWPTSRGAAVLLDRWGLPGATSAQITEAVRYLWQRRLLCVVLFVALPPLTGLTPGLGIFLPLLVAMLIAELVATLRPVSGVRFASLHRRSWRDLVPRWAIATAGLLTVLTVVLAVFAIGVGDTTGWVALGSAAVCLGAVGLLVQLSVRRHAVADAAVDAALRVRTARVAVGIGFGWLGAAVLMAAHWLPFDGLLEIVGFVAQVGAICAWVWVTTPTRHSLVTAVR